jgi:hypothetical protein
LGALLRYWTLKRVSRKKKSKMITTFSIVIGITLLVALGVLWHSIVHSPDGHEDSSGFHLDNDQRVASTRRQASDADAIGHTMAVSRTEHPFA